MRRMFGGLVGLALLAATAGAWSCCCIPRVPIGTQPANMSLPNQKAFIYREGDLEHLIISVQYSGASSQFAWVVPVETRPQVDVLGGAAFHELQALTTIQLVEQSRSIAPGAPQMAGAAPPPVQVLERKEAGPFDIAVLKSATTGGLYTWLQTNGFAVTPDQHDILEHYVRKNWVFIAARIRPASTANGEVASHLQDGTIAPLHIRYKTHDLSYPLYVTSVNPGLSHMDLYVAEDAIQPAPGFEDARFRLAPQGDSAFAVRDAPPGAVLSAEAPTVRKLLPNGAVLHHLTATMAAHDRQRDLVFAHISDHVGDLDAR